MPAITRTNIPVFSRSEEQVMTSEKTIPQWQRNLASLIRTNLYKEAKVVPQNGLYYIYGVYGDKSVSAPFAKFETEWRANLAVQNVHEHAGKYD